jgi:chromosome segregation ATPase
LLEERTKIATEMDNWTQELALTQPRLKEMEGRILECNHRDLQEKDRNLERELCAGAPEQVDLVGDLEDAQAHQEIIRQSTNKYPEQVTQILKLTEGKTGGGGHP